MKSIQPNVFGKCRRKREGRGFSLKELEKAELTPMTACRLCVSIDKRRGSVLDENVKVLKYLKAESKKK